MIIYGEESWADCKDEIIPLARDHFEECKATHGEAEFDLDVNALDNLNANGMVHVTTARDSGRLVAYIVNIVMPRHVLFNRSFSSHLAWYVVPEMRKMTGLKILKKSEEYLRDKVDMMQGMHTATTDCSGMFLRLGWHKSETSYMKWVK